MRDIFYLNDANCEQYLVKQMDIMFENIAKLIFQEVEAGRVQMVIVLRKPVKFQVLDQNEKGANKFKDIISPFMFKKTIQTESHDGEAYSCEVRFPLSPYHSLQVPDEDKMYMNAWNLKQVIVIEGQMPITVRLQQIFNSIKASDMIPKVFMFKYDADKEQLVTGSDSRIKILKLLDPAKPDQDQS